MTLRNLTEAQLLFNKLLSRNRVKSENAFGILTQAFGIYQTAMQMDLEIVEIAVLATIALHNFRRKTNQAQIIDSNEIFSQDYANLNQTPSDCEENITGKALRDKIMNLVYELYMSE